MRLKVSNNFMEQAMRFLKKMPFKVLCQMAFYCKLPTIMYGFISFIFLRTWTMLVIVFLVFLYLLVKYKVVLQRCLNLPQFDK